MRRHVSVAFLTCAALFSTSLAHAQTDAEKKEAQKRFDQGLDRYDKGDYETARLSFLQAYAVLNSVDILMNLAKAEVKTGHALEAIEHVKQLLRDPRTLPQERPKILKVDAEAKSVTGHIAIDAPKGADIFLDRIPMGDVPAKDTLDVVPGKHAVMAQVGQESHSVTIDAPPGQVVTARFSFMTPPAPVVVAPVPLASPSPSPVAQDPPRALPHDDDTRDHVQPREHRFWTPRVITAASLGVGALLAGGAGAYFLVDAGNRRSDAQASLATLPGNPSSACGGAKGASPVCQHVADLKSSFQTDQTLATVTFIGAGVLLASSVAVYVLWPERKDRSSWVVPVVSPGTAGFAAVGTF